MGGCNLRVLATVISTTVVVLLLGLIGFQRGTLLLLNKENGSDNIEFGCEDYDRYGSHGAPLSVYIARILESPSTNADLRNLLKSTNDTLAVYRRGVTVVLDEYDWAYQSILRDDIYKLAPRGYNEKPIFVKEMDRTNEVAPMLQDWERERYHDSYLLPVKDYDIHRMIQAFYLVLAIRPDRSVVLVLEANTSVDWSVFSRDRIHDIYGFQEGYGCFLRPGENKCESFNGIYPLNTIKKILSNYEQGLARLTNNKHTLQEGREYLGWQKYLVDMGVHCTSIPGVIWGSASENSVQFGNDFLYKDPRYRAVMRHNSMKDVFQHDVHRIMRKVEFIPPPKWLITPLWSSSSDDETHKCRGINGVWMMESTAKGRKRRDFYRQVFERWYIEDVYFILGRPKDDNELSQIQREASDFDDIVMYDVVDHYKLLTYKGYAAMTFIKEFCPDAASFVKIDHDVMFNPSFFPSAEEAVPFGTESGKIDWDKLSAIECPMGCFHKNPVGRKNIPVFSYAHPHKSWPYKFHPDYCGGPFYLIKMEPMLKILDFMKTFTWMGMNLSTSSMSNEDVMITGRFRVLAGVFDIKRKPTSLNLDTKHWNRIEDTKFIQMANDYLRLMSRPVHEELSSELVLNMSGDEDPLVSTKPSLL